MQTSRKELIDQNDDFAKCMILFVCMIVIFLINGCQKNEIEISSKANSYSKITSGTRQFEWDTDNDTGWIRGPGRQRRDQRFGRRHTLLHRQKQ